MNKFFVIFFLLILLCSCVTTKKNNDFPEIDTKVGVSQDQVKNDVIEYKFVQWKCYKSHWLNKYKQLAYTIGYFPEFRKIDQNSKIGMSLLNDTKEKKLAIYSRKGVQHYWDWGGEKYNNYQIIIHPSGNGWFYNFENTKSGEQISPKHTYDCQSSETTYISIKNIKNILNELKDVPNFELRNLKNIVQVHMNKCFKLNFSSINNLKNHPTVSLQIFINNDGLINSTSIVDRKKYENDAEYKIIADIANKAALNCLYLPIPNNKIKLFKNFIMKFDPKFILEK